MSQVPAPEARRRLTRRTTGTSSASVPYKSVSPFESHSTCRSAVPTLGAPRLQVTRSSTLKAAPLLASTSIVSPSSPYSLCQWKTSPVASDLDPSTSSPGPVRTVPADEVRLTTGAKEDLLCVCSPAADPSGPPSSDSIDSSRDRGSAGAIASSSSSPPLSAAGEAPRTAGAAGPRRTDARRPRARPRRCSVIRFLASTTVTSSVPPVGLRIRLSIV